MIKPREIAEPVVTGRKTAAEMPRVHDVSQLVISLIVARYAVDHP